ncbi:MFS general substrate transporter [Lipomyces doorenjongii]
MDDTIGAQQLSASPIADATILVGDQSTDLEKLESQTESAAGLHFGDHDEVSEKERAGPARQRDDDRRRRGPLDWDSPDDPDDPHNWPLSKRMGLLNSVGLLCLSVTFGTSAIVGGIPQIMQQYHVSETAAYLTVTIYLLGLSLGPTLGAPISELFGRRIVYLTTLPLAMCFAVGAALSPTFAGHLICRFLCSLMGSPVLAVSAGTIADLFRPAEQGLALAYFCATGAFMGPTLGPVVGGWVATKKDWKWTQWVYLMLGGAVMIPLLFIKESYKPVILARRAKKRGLAPPAKLPARVALKMVAVITLTRPVKMLLTDPVVSSLSIYSAFVFAVLLAFFEGLPYIFMTVYDFSIGDSGLVFVAIGVGVLLSLAIAFVIDRIWYQPVARTMPVGEIPRAELRLYCGFVGSVLLPVSLFWIGWSSRRSIHWIVPTIGAVPFGCSLTLLFFAVATYLVDCYTHLYGASALAANNMLRYLVASVFPLFTRQMYENLGIGWANSLLGFIAVGLMPLPFLMMKFGPGLRERGLKNLSS